MRKYTVYILYFFHQEWFSGSIMVIGLKNGIDKPTSISNLICLTQFILITLEKVWIYFSYPPRCELNSRVDRHLNLGGCQLRRRQIGELTKQWWSLRQTTTLYFPRRYENSQIIRKKYLRRITIEDVLNKRVFKKLSCM